MYTRAGQRTAAAGAAARSSASSPSGVVVARAPRAAPASSARHIAPAAEFHSSAARHARASSPAFQEAAAAAASPSSSHSAPSKSAPAAALSFPASPAPEDVAAFVAGLDKLSLGLRVQELAAAQRAAAAAHGEAHAASTLVRQLARMLLTKEEVAAADVANPAQHWARTYKDLGADRAAWRSRADAAAAAAGTDGAGAGGAARPGAPPSSPSASAWQQKRSEADAAFGTDAALSEGAARESAASAAAAAAAAETPAEASSSSSSSAAGKSSPSSDSSPLIGGALSLVPHGSLAPVASAPSSSFVPTAAGLLYLDAVVEQLEAALASLLGGARALPPAPAGFDAAKADAVVALIVGSGGSASSSASLLPAAHAAWLAGLPAAHAAHLQALVSSARRAGLVAAASPAAALAARTAKLEAAVAVLKRARAGKLGGGSSSLPTVRALNAALAAAVGAGVEGFTSTTSAAAHVAGRIQETLRAAERQLNAAAAWASRPGGKGAQAAAASSFSLQVPSVEALVALPCPEAASVRVTEKKTGRTLTLALRADAQGAEAAADAAEAASARLDAGHVPTMLAPLMRVLTPSQWAAVDTVARAALPDWTACLPASVSAAASAAGAAAASQSAGSIADSVPALAGAGGGAVSVVASTPSASVGSIVNPTGAPNSVLSALAAQSAGEGLSTSVGGTEAVKRAFDGAPSAAARAHYTAYLLRMRAGEEALARARAQEAQTEAIAAQVGASADAVRAQLRAAWRADPEGPGPQAVQAAADLEALCAENGAAAAALAGVTYAPAARGTFLLAPGDAPDPITPQALAQAHEDLRAGRVGGFGAGEEGAAAGGSAFNPVLALARGAPGSDSAFTRDIAASALAGLAPSAVALSPAPLPALHPAHLAWAAARAASGFVADASGPAKVPSARSSSSAAAAAPLPLVVRMPSLAINAEAVARGMASSAAFMPDELQRRRAARLAALDREVELTEAATAAGARAGDIDPRWWRFAYGPGPSYRSPEHMSLLHHRLLEAVEARDLDAAWALYAEHSALEAQEGAPDVLALEILLDACARARRADLVFGVLWPRTMHLRVRPTPEMRLAFIKAAALTGDAGLAASLLRLAVKEGAGAADVRHYHAAVSAHLHAREWAKAYALFNLMKRRGVGATGPLFATLFNAAADAGRAEDCFYIFRAMERSPAVPIPAPLYTRIVDTFAQQGNLATMEAALARMGRKVDGGLRPEPAALVAALQAYVAHGEAAGAEGIIRCVGGALSTRTHTAQIKGPALNLSSSYTPFSLSPPLFSPPRRLMEAGGHFAEGGVIPRSDAEGLLAVLKGGGSGGQARAKGLGLQLQAAAARKRRMEPPASASGDAAVLESGTAAGEEEGAGAGAGTAPADPAFFDKGLIAEYGLREKGKGKGAAAAGPKKAARKPELR
jgi:pentatricopeptide repeat protein